MVCYFAHSIKSYGSKEERNALKFLRKKYKKVFNPGIMPSRKMPFYLKKVSRSDILVYMEYRGTVGKGVYTEILYAIQQKKPVYKLFLYEGVYKLLPARRLFYRDTTNWADGYGKVI